MPAVVIPSTLKIECEGTVSGRPWVNVFHCLKPAVYPEETAAAIAGRFRTDFYGQFLDSLKTTWTCTTQRVTDISTATGSQYEYNTAVVGTASNELLSPDTALCVTWLTVFRGRSFRGRNYLAGFTEASNTADGHIEAATITNVQGGVDLLIDNMSAAGTDLMVASRVLLSSEPVTLGRINNVWDRQKRRNYR